MNAFLLFHRGPLTTCLHCRCRRTPVALRYRRLSSNPSRQSEKIPVPLPTAEENKISNHGKRDYAPRPLTQPLGLPNPPLAGENSGIDSRTWGQWKEDLMNREKKLQQRKILKSQFVASYFADFNAMTKEHKGKSWIAPQALFKADFARYFPNLQGQTLLSPAHISDTSEILKGKVSLVSVFSSLWAENQVHTFMNDKAVKDTLQKNEDVLQKVDINVEENFLKAWLIKLFSGNLRHKIPKADHGRYFLVTRGLTDEIRISLGLLNSRVGYVYLLDKDCKIRWAASGNATDEEKQSMVRLINRLAEAQRREKMLS